MAIDWQRLKQLLAGTLPISDCLTATQDPAATPQQVNPKRQRIIKKQGTIAKPISAPMAPSVSISKNGEKLISLNV